MGRIDGETVWTTPKPYGTGSGTSVGSSARTFPLRG